MFKEIAYYNNLKWIYNLKVDSLFYQTLKNRNKFLNNEKPNLIFYKKK